MAYRRGNSFWGTLLSIMLIVLGFLLLLDSFNILGDVTELFLAIVFAAGSFVGLTFYLKDRQRWWALIPSAVLAGIAGILLINTFHLRMEDGSFMMFTLALAFWIIFSTDKRQQWAIIPALLFTFVGIVSNVRRPEIFIGFVFSLTALIGYGYYLRHSHHWWILIPSSALLGVGGIMILNSLHLHRFEVGSFMLLALALGFWIIYIRHQEHWWAGIPAGILTSIGFMINLDRFAAGNLAAAFLLCGFGLTFWLLWLRRQVDGTGWAIWPASALTAISFMVSIGDNLAVFWPLVFIGVGGWLLIRNLVGNRRMKTASANNEPHQKPAEYL